RGEGGLHRGHPPPPRHSRAHLQVRELGRLALKALGQLTRAPHGLAQQDPRDRQGLLNQRADVGELPLAFGSDPAPLGAPPTRQPTQTKTGSTPKAKAPGRQSSRNLAPPAASTVVTLDTIDVAVLVTTLCTPPMSFAIRDWISPVRVRVKKANERRCRCR